MIANNNRKIHILHTEASCGWDGQSRRILLESCELIKKGHKVTIMCYQDSPLYKYAKEKQIPVVGAPITKKRLKGVKAVYKWLLQHSEIDLICTHSSQDAWLVALAQLFLKKKTLVVRTRHTSDPVSKNFISRWLYTKATNHIVTTGRPIKNMMIERNSFHHDTISSIPTAIDSDIYSPAKNKEAIKIKLKLPITKKIIGVVSMLRKEKGHAYLIEAFTKMNHDNVHLLLVGGGSMEEEIRNQIKRLNLENHITLAGYQNEPLEYFQSMDIFVFPSTCNEGLPQVLSQAILCEVPIVTTSSGAIPEFIEHQQTGLIVARRSAEEIYQSCQYLLENNDVTKDFTIKAKQRLLEKNSLKQMIEKIETVYLTIAI